VIDVAIVGGGVAGSTIAMVLARRGLSTLVIERSAYDTLRIGETLPPAIREVLAELGVWDRFVGEGHTPSFGTYAAWGSAALQSNDFIFNPYGHGWHVDRAQFDRMLAAVARDAGVVIRDRTRLLSHRHTDEGWELQIGRPEQPERVLARFLVDASGRSASVARANGAVRQRVDRLVGTARIHAVQAGAIEPDSFTMVEAVPDGWWYSAFLPSRRLITVWLTDADLRPQALDIGQTKHTSARVDCCGEVSAPFVLAADSARLDRVIGPGWLAVGDAACAFDPLSSQGILHAMRLGIAAGHAIAEYRAGDQAALTMYAEEVRHSFDRCLLVRKRYYGQERRWPASVFWSRRQ
jgi:flavin-dependent dehydrogenase